MTSRSPRDLVLTLYGDFLLHRPVAVWVGSLIVLLEPLGLSEGYVRTTLSRMTSRGWFETERAGRRSYYRLSARGRRLLEEGEARIYHPPQNEVWDGEWTLIAYSIPESQRQLRDRLRVRLTWLGFGSVGNGLWISPHDVRERVAAIAEELDVASYLEVFRGAHLGSSDARRLVSQCWDIGSINTRYEAFIDRHLSDFRAMKAKGSSSISSREAYVRRFELVHEYREFPLLDPFLPRPLQTEEWAGECALGLFQAYHDLLVEPAEAFVEEHLEVAERAESATPAAV